MPRGLVWSLRRLISRCRSRPSAARWRACRRRRLDRDAGTARLPLRRTSGGKSPVASPKPRRQVDRKRSNLPQVLTSFVGREREIAEIKRLLPTTRLLTLTGTGGIGKTRLAVQAAAEVLDAYRDGVWFVDLAPLTDPALVPNALAQVLGVKESAGQPLLQDAVRILARKGAVAGARQLRARAGRQRRSGGRLAARHRAGKRCRHQPRIIACRRGAHVSAERRCRCPIRRPAAATIARSDAVQLFVDRARQHRPRFDLRGAAGAARWPQICVRLDGLPLALELAAARVAVLPVEEIVRLLDQRFRLLTRGSRRVAAATDAARDARLELRTA